MSSTPAAPLLERARLWAAARYPYLAAALFALQPVEAQESMLAVDGLWRVFVHPRVAEEWTPEQLATGLIHQVEHLLRNHLERAPDDADPARDRWPLAADAEIDDDLVRERLPLPPGFVTPARFGLPDGLLAEEYLRRLRAVDASVLARRPDLRACGSCRAVGEASELVDGDVLPGLTPVQIEAVRHRVALDIAG